MEVADQTAGRVDAVTGDSAGAVGRRLILGVVTVYASALSTYGRRLRQAPSE